MKAMLQFELPEESPEHQLALDGGRWMSVCHELDEWLRGLEKHDGARTVAPRDVRAKLWVEMQGRQLSFE